MNVIHIMRDGSTKKDITGHVVKLEDARMLYDFMTNLNRATKYKKRENIHKVS